MNAHGNHLFVGVHLAQQAPREGLAAARARGRKGGRPCVMTANKLRYAVHLISDRERSILSICAELGGMRPSTLYHYLHANGALKGPGRDLPGNGSGQSISNGADGKRSEDA